MLDSDITQHLNYCEFLLRSFKDHLPDLMSTLRESSAGFPTGHEGRTELDDDGEEVTFQSRTEAAALHHDPAREGRKVLERNAKALRNAMVNLDGLRQDWLTTTNDKPKGTQELGCDSCNRANVWSPRRQLPTVAGDKNPRYENLCQWCSDWNRAEEQYPPQSVLNAHHEGRRITSALLDKLGIKTKGSARDRRKAC